MVAVCFETTPSTLSVHGDVIPWCSPGEGTSCCDRQFVLRDGIVEAYRQVPSLGGLCSAEARLYPGGQWPGAPLGFGEERGATTWGGTFSSAEASPNRNLARSRSRPTAHLHR
jgi:hypothetical protein